MADDAPATSGAAGGAVHTAGDDHDIHHLVPQQLQNVSRRSTLTKSAFDYTIAVQTGGANTPMSAATNRHSRIMPDLDEYFVGPRDLEKHSKLPYFMQMHGSVLPRMILPMTMIGCWATLITCIHMLITPLAVNNLLLTVLGFVVGLALSFRSSTAYERYSDGRKTWSTLSVQCRNLARNIWVHIDERHDPLNPQVAKDDLLAKVTALNLILAFTVSLKHKLRFEPYAHYPDIRSLVGHLDTFAKAAHREDNYVVKKKTPWKTVGEYLGMSMANSNPRKELKRSALPLGNLPLEILTYLSSYIEETSVNGTLKNPVVVGQVLTNKHKVGQVAALTDCQASAERVLSTPLPVGYNILISQIVLLYVYILPFQLVSALQWITIPGTFAAAYIIIGLASIGNELENPFGNDVNDLPLDQYCAELAKELDVLSSVRAPKFSSFLTEGSSKVLWPLSESGVGEWRERSEADIRSALRAKVVVPKAGRAGIRSRTPSVKDEVSV
ncbi:UPF0187 protein [Lachnellula suecica]|uniref:UPF0187 protein n=1 Tax=Lachnellula suecica TaxID=602035 RepID=A0A8T9BVY1_9HELO|nr:UPF0187 protein [Lachnellula suecica]